MTSALRAALPDADEEEIAALAEVGEGAPGRAIAWRGLDIAALDRAMDALVREGDPANAPPLGAGAEPGAQIGPAALRGLPRPRAVAHRRRGPRAERRRRCAEALRLWERASALAGSARRLSLDPQSIVFELAGMLAALAPARRSAATPLERALSRQPR